ncbi:LysM peptidoglycan-binding domain-containing protein [Aeromicrobium ginsengisoli]|uniref:LysM peptidoglycan-binding domain-containing protein n=1 Tax=Aeromicrobium ginsengisoli TaxID=363867 RepID=A0A5M4FCA3_9ACTN|nr:LysM peptidoglycan-binding domain-containing protein [Aeromicrobium ginsengisoli]KAA1395520.1 LysM peptidoglycan-binding domain-containing protein [Aeromicrobium ginsengisoli]
MTSTIERSPHNRLPAITEEPSRFRQVATGILALLGTLAIVFGVPVALLAAFGTPWPDQKPSVEWLSTPTTGETVLSVLAVVVWLAWAHFVVCLVVEAVAERRKSGLAPRIPGGGIGTQGLARRLVSSIVLLAAATSVGMSSASAVEASAPTQASQSHLVSAALESPAVPQADRAELADGTLPAVKTLDDATPVDLAEGVTTYYDVKPPDGRHYDTLWDIADRYLGDGFRYKEIWDLNKGVTQPDGRVLQKADLIYPGWVMKLPNDAKGPGLKVIDHAADAKVDEPAADVDQAAPIDEVDTAAVADQADVATADDAGGGIHLGSWSPLFGVAGGLVVAGASLALRRRRNAAPAAAWWSARTPTDPDPHHPDPGSPPPGAKLRDEADLETASWLNRALRSLGGAPGMPAPLRASVSGGGMAIAFDVVPDVAPPAGWSARAKVWTLDRDHDPESPGLSALPGMASVGRRDDGSILMLDPESISGVLSLDGDSETARGVALSMAIDTATHAWADDRLVTLVGFAGDVSTIGEGAIRRTDDLERVLESLDNVARFQRAACREAESRTIREARATAPTADWTYHLVVCSGVPNADELARLEALASDPQVALGVVIVGGVRDAAVRLTARPDGRISSPLHSVDVAAQVITPAAADALASLYEPVQAARRVSIDQLVDTLEAEQQITAAHEAVASIRVLGPVQVEASGEVEPERVAFLTELACFLALHPAGVHANRISAALWPRGVDPQVRDGALRQVADWLGTTAAGTAALEQESGVWRLAPGAVDLDWDRFREALNRAAEDGTRRETHMRTALALVAGLAFSGVPVGRYGWLESMPVEGDIAMAVSLTVQACAEAAAARDDEPAARAVLAQGLTLLPASEELWRSRLRLAAHFGERDDLRSVVDEMYAAIAEHGSVVGSSAETDVLVDELVPGYRTHVA